MADVSTALLLSGGMDSIALAWWLRPELALTINYGQRPAAAEIRASQAAADSIGIQHHVIGADLSSLGSGDLSGSAPLGIAPVTEWWPFRNQMLITLAAMRGVSLGVTRLLIGTVKSDSAHADGTVAFIKSMNDLLCLQEGGITLEAPAIALSACELLHSSAIPMEILAWAHSCHVANEPCGYCRGCRKHYETLMEFGVAPY